MIKLITQKFIPILILLFMLSLATACFGRTDIDSARAEREEFEVEWRVTRGGMWGDYGTFVAATSDGGYVFTGEISEKACLIKADAEGRILWEKSFERAGFEERFSILPDTGIYVQQTDDGGYILAGESSFRIREGISAKEVWLLKTDAEGNELWRKTFGNENSKYLEGAVQASDGGYLLLGLDTPTSGIDNNNSEPWLIKTDAEGNEIWEKKMAEKGEGRLHHVEQTADGGYVMTGRKREFHKGLGNEVWLIKTDAEGNAIWEKTFGGSHNDYGCCVQQTSDGGYIISGTTDSFTISKKTADWLIKVDADGNEIWSKSISGCDSFGNSVQQTSDGGYIVTGSRYNDELATAYDDHGYILKTDSEGCYQWDIRFRDSKGGYGRHIIETDDGGCIVIGNISKPPHLFMIWNIDTTYNLELFVIKIKPSTE